MSNRLFKSFGYAFEGILTLFKETPNAKIHLFSAICIIILAWIFQLDIGEWTTLILCIGFVICAEAFNTAVETITDLASPDIHPLAKKTKDMAAGAVLISAITAAVIGLIIFLPKIFTLISAL